MRTDRTARVLERSELTFGARDRALALGLFALALVLRLAHLVTAYDAPFLSILYIDPLMYDEWGLRIAAGQLASERPFFLDPLYAYFLGLIYAVFGHHYLAVVAVQSALGALVTLLVFFPVRRWFDLPTATVAGAFAAVYLPAIFYGTVIMKPPLSLFLVALWLWLVSAALRRDGWGLWLVAGVVLGLACLTRGNLLLAAPLLTLWILLRDGWCRPARARWLEAGASSAGLALVLLLPAAHNWTVGRELILTTANAGANFYIGNNPANESGEYQHLPFIRANPKYEQEDFRREAERRAGRALGDREASRFWFRESWSWLRDHPGAGARLFWTKLRAFWGAWEIPDSLDYYLVREEAPVLRLPIPGFGLLAPLALLGGVLAWRRGGWPRLVVLLVAGHCLTVVAFFVFSRFRMAIVPALYVLAAHGAVELVRRLRAWVPRQALVAVGLFLAFLFFTNVPVRARTDSWSYRLAQALGLPTRGETSSLGCFNRGVAYAAEASDAAAPADESRWLARAETELRRAVALLDARNDSAQPHVELGKVLARQHRDREALAVYRDGLRIEPGDFRIHHALGLLHDRVGELQQAAEAYREALRLMPQHAPSAVRLGHALLRLGRPDEAAEAYRHALSLSPDNEEAHRGLAAATGVKS